MNELQARDFALRAEHAARSTPEGVSFTLRQCARAIRWLLDRKRRPSTPERRYYFAVMAAAFDHWPESAEFQPNTVDDLRCYLQLKGGHGYRIAKEDETGQRTVYLLPKSISDKAISHEEFNRVASRIYTILHTQFGLHHQDLLEGQEYETA